MPFPHSICLLVLYAFCFYFVFGGDYGGDGGGGCGGCGDDDLLVYLFWLVADFHPYSN